jgi:hypothetical protein
MVDHRVEGRHQGVVGQVLEDADVALPVAWPGAGPVGLAQADCEVGSGEGPRQRAQPRQQVPFRPGQVGAQGDQDERASTASAGQPRQHRPGLRGLGDRADQLEPGRPVPAELQLAHPEAEDRLRRVGGFRAVGPVDPGALLAQLTGEDQSHPALHGAGRHPPRRVPGPVAGVPWGAPASAVGRRASAGLQHERRWHDRDPADPRGLCHQPRHRRGEVGDHQGRLVPLDDGCQLCPGLREEGEVGRQLPGKPRRVAAHRAGRVRDALEGARVAAQHRIGREPEVAQQPDAGRAGGEPGVEPLIAQSAGDGDQRVKVTAERRRRQQQAHPG